jgi:enoyl-CoA hydratase/carnithine racemase
VDAVVAGLRVAAPLTIRATKQQLLHRAMALEAEPVDDDALLERVYGSADFREGVRSFLAKEKPRFSPPGRS